MSDGRMNGGFELFQVGLNASDLAASLRFYAEIFGFANAGGQAGWGPGMALQGLEAGGQTLIWWMVGRQKRVQFELFHHTGPTQRPQPADWSPTDHGWVRIGLVVSDFARPRGSLRMRRTGPCPRTRRAPGTPRRT